MQHIPVLIEEVLEGLNIDSEDNVIDCTLGDGGHAEKILEKNTSGKLLGIDADVESLLRSKRNLYKFEDRVVFARDNFVNLKKIIEENDFSPVNGILIDLGWSSPQFAERGRGFSFGEDEPLDMRYNSSQIESENTETAAEILNEKTKEELSSIFKKFGEEKFSAEIALAIIKAREVSEINTTNQLVEIILQVYREKLKSEKEVPWIGGIHPATKIFQALRIAVNKELEVLKEVLPQAVEILAPGGRLAVISFHSLEDRIVKHYFKNIENKQIKLINKKPIIASEEELQNNPRARSAKLRVVEKI